MFFSEIIKTILMVTIVKEMFVKVAEIFYVNPNIVTGVLPYNDQGEILLCKRSIEPETALDSASRLLENGESIQEGAERET